MVPSPSTPHAAKDCGLQGCMKSGPVLTEKRFKWYEPDSWRFGDAQVLSLSSSSSPHVQ